MWYEVPKEKPAPPMQKPKPIFPWEERGPHTTTRVFAEDVSSPQPEARSQFLAGDEGEATTSARGDTTSTPSIKVTSDEIPPSYTPTTRNAWDEISGIDSYVRQLSELQRLRGKLSVLQRDNPQTQSPVNEETPTNAAGPGRRESLRLTDFPSAVERPSLPVTPAPMRKAFWGEERDDAGRLPQAEGVPSQSEWVRVLYVLSIPECIMLPVTDSSLRSPCVILMARFTSC